MNVGLYGGYCVKQLDDHGRARSGRSAPAGSRTWRPSYRFAKVLFTLGVQNLFDEYPEQVLLPLQPQGVRYSTTNTFGINGRFLYARASVKF